MSADARRHSCGLPATHTSTWLLLLVLLVLLLLPAHPALPLLLWLLLPDEGARRGAGRRGRLPPRLLLLRPLCCACLPRCCSSRAASAACSQQCGQLPYQLLCMACQVGFTAISLQC